MQTTTVKRLSHTWTRRRYSWPPPSVPLRRRARLRCSRACWPSPLPPSICWSAACRLPPARPPGIMPSRCRCECAPPSLPPPPLTQISYLFRPLAPQAAATKAHSVQRSHWRVSLAAGRQLHHDLDHVSAAAGAAQGRQTCRPLTRPPACPPVCLLSLTRLIRHLQISHWLPDEQVLACPLSGKKFGMFERRHHCRISGGVYADEACNY